MNITGSGLPPAAGALPTGVGIVEGSVDSAGNVTLTPLQDGGASASYAPGIEGNVYAGQNINVRVYANAATQTTKNGQKIWTMEYGVRNYLPYPIGSSQGSANPSDTTGIYLVYLGEPTILAPGNCHGCTISITRYDGIGNFTSPNQKYLYWHERLAAKQLVAGADTVSHRDTIVFTSSPSVSNFKFYMMVGADWPAPHQSFWSVLYDASRDSTPDANAKPPWHTGSMSPVSSGTEKWTASTGSDSIRLAAPNGNFTCCTDYYLYRRDSLADNTPAYMQATVSLKSNETQTQPEAVFGFLDGSHMAAVGLTKNKVGFVQYVSVQHTIFFFLPITVPEARFISAQAQCSVDATQDHAYLLQKTATSVVLTVDGSACATLNNSQLPAQGTSGSASFVTSGSAEFFGQGSSSGSGTSAWKLVTYGIGATQP